MQTEQIIKDSSISSTATAAVCNEDCTMSSSSSVNVAACSGDSSSISMNKVSVVGAELWTEDLHKVVDALNTLREHEQGIQDQSWLLHSVLHRRPEFVPLVDSYHRAADIKSNTRHHSRAPEPHNEMLANLAQNSRKRAAKARNSRKQKMKKVARKGGTTVFMPPTATDGTVFMPPTATDGTVFMPPTATDGTVFMPPTATDGTVFMPPT
eukprot:Lankesteria_metandrocarpae@DN1896_c0_g1_i1.p1